MLKLGVITDGISRDLEHAAKTMLETGLHYAELQYIWNKEIGDQSRQEMQLIKDLLVQHELKVSCISRHNFSGLSAMDTKPEDRAYRRHLRGLKRCIKAAKELGTNLVRIMSFRKEMIIFGYNGAEEWVASSGSWDRLLRLMEMPVRLAEDEDVCLVVETGNNAMITSGVLAKKLIDDLGTKHLRILWDISNTLYCAEAPFPDLYEEIRDYIGHIHLKDCKVDIPRATVRFCSLGTGDMAPYLEQLMASLQKDNFGGVISLESVFKPDQGTFEEGFRLSLPTFKRLANGRNG